MTVIYRSLSTQPANLNTSMFCLNISCPLMAVSFLQDCISKPKRRILAEDNHIRNKRTMRSAAFQVERKKCNHRTRLSGSST
jgi:hypothetical protein